MEFFKNLWNTISGYTLHRFLPALFMLLIGMIVIKVVMGILKKAFARSKMEKAAVTLITSVARIVMILLVCLIVASSLGIDVTGVVALASVLTLALSLAVQDALANLIGGFTLLHTKPFHIGDYVEIGGECGTVQQIGLTYTQLLSPDRKTISLPNSSVVSAQIINYTVDGSRRVDITVSASYLSEPEQVIAALLEAANVPTAYSDPAPYAALTAYNDSSISYVLMIYSSAGDYRTTLHTVNLNIRNVFNARGIEMSYPHLNVHLDR